jgi:hypothetical protein
MKRFLPPLILTLTLIVVACAPSQASTNQSVIQLAPASTTSAPSSGNNANTSTDMKRSDGQGMVTVDVTPMNLSNPSNQLEFDVSLNTHSVDLSMDFAKLATLTTDTGITVQATSWDGQAGGHHVSGKLIFPATKDGKSVLNGASKLTLTIINVDAPSRVFEWQLK